MEVQNETNDFCVSNSIENMHTSRNRGRNLKFARISYGESPLHLYYLEKIVNFSKDLKIFRINEKISEKSIRKYFKMEKIYRKNGSW